VNVEEEGRHPRLGLGAVTLLDGACDAGVSVDHQLPGAGQEAAFSCCLVSTASDSTRVASTSFPLPSATATWNAVALSMNSAGKLCSRARISPSVVATLRPAYGIVPDGIISYVLGDYGSLRGPIDADVRDRVLGSKRARTLSQPKPEPSLDDLRRTFGAGIPEQELLLRSVLPAAQVDAMLSASPAPS
jgi:hypothetical protein